MFFCVREVECCPLLGPTKFLDVGSDRVNESVSGKGVCRTARLHRTVSKILS